MAALGFHHWRRLLGRWCPLDESPEVRLILWLLASAITEEPELAHKGGRKPYEGGFFGGGFQAYCAAVQLDGQFVIEQINRACASPVRVLSKREARAAA